MAHLASTLCSKFMKMHFFCLLSSKGALATLDQTHALLSKCSSYLYTAPKAVFSCLVLTSCGVPQTAVVELQCPVCETCSVAL